MRRNKLRACRWIVKIDKYFSWVVLLATLGPSSKEQPLMVSGSDAFSRGA